jgi:hypothetical protein
MAAEYFVGIGAQRAGTTWLGNYLNHHPQVCFSPIKELHYFDTIFRPDLCSRFNDEFKNLHRSYGQSGIIRQSPEEILYRQCLQTRIEMIEDPEKYRQYFEQLIKNQHLVFGEITPSYSLLNKNGFQSINQMFPEAKFIFIIRNPCDRFWSHLNFHQSRFSDFTALDQVENCLNLPQYHLRTDYKRTITELFNVVNPDRILIIFFENLFDSNMQQPTLNRITSFLQISQALPDTKSLNETKKNPLPVEHRKRIFQHFQFVYEFICQNYPEQIPQSWLDDLRTFEG